MTIRFFVMHGEEEENSLANCGSDLRNQSQFSGVMIGGELHVDDNSSVIDTFVSREKPTSKKSRSLSCHSFCFMSFSFYPRGKKHFLGPITTTMDLR